jgi:hypothetical protein
MLLNKAKNAQLDSFLTSLLDLHDVEVIAVRGKECRAIFMNNAAKNRLDMEELDGAACRSGYFNLLPGLCQRCPTQDTPTPSGRPLLIPTTKTGAYIP